MYKEKIISVLKKAHLVSIADIQKSVPVADFSTVFRNMEQLHENGLVRKVVVSKDTVLYELVETSGHHDHFVCNGCGAVESVQVPKVKLSGKAIATDILVRGVCNDCVS